MSLTFFSIPRPMHPPFDRIQFNAVWSWAQIPGAKVVLFGDEYGIDQLLAISPVVKQVNIVARNQNNTPLVNSLIQQIGAETDGQWVAYINADIVVSPGLALAIEQVRSQQIGPHVMMCRRWDTDVPFVIPTDDPHWFQTISDHVGDQKALYGANGIDFILFPQGLYDAMPPFSIGWPGAAYDNWMVWEARRQGVPVIELTDQVVIFHQNHPVQKSEHPPAKMKEKYINHYYMGGYGYCYDMRDATHRLNQRGVVEPLPFPIQHWRLHLKRRIQRLVDGIRFRWRRPV